MPKGLSLLYPVLRSATKPVYVIQSLYNAHSILKCLRHPSQDKTARKSKLYAASWKDIKIGLNCRIPRNLFASRSITKVSIVLCLVLQSISTHVNEVVGSCGVFCNRSQECLFDVNIEEEVKSKIGLKGRAFKICNNRGQLGHLQRKLVAPLWLLTRPLSNSKWYVNLRFRIPFLLHVFSAGCYISCWIFKISDLTSTFKLFPTSQHCYRKNIRWSKRSMEKRWRN